MPTTYTHYRFGHDVMRRLNPRYHQVIESYQELFDAGLHGPDLLFYYHALSGNDVIRLGNQLHRETGRSFFEHAGEIVKMGTSGAHIAYVFGFLCHFALDRTAMKEFIRYLDLLICGSDIKRNTIYKALDLAHQKGFKDLIFCKEPIPACEKSNQDLAAIYEASIDDAVRLIQEYPATIAGKKPWNELYLYNFEGELLSD